MPISQAGLVWAKKRENECVFGNCQKLPSPLLSSSFSVSSIFQGTRLVYRALTDVPALPKLWKNFCPQESKPHPYTDLSWLTRGLHPDETHVNWKYSRLKIYLKHLNYQIPCLAKPTLNMRRTLPLAYNWAKTPNTKPIF